MKKIIVLTFVLLLCFNVVALDTASDCEDQLCRISFKESNYWIDSQGNKYSDKDRTFVDPSEGALLNDIETSADYRTAITFLREEEATSSSSSSLAVSAVPSVRAPAEEKDPEKKLVKNIQEKVKAGETTFSREYDNRIASAQQAMRIAQSERRIAYKKGFTDADAETTIRVKDKTYKKSGLGWVDADDNAQKLAKGAKVTAAKGEATYDGTNWRYKDNTMVPSEEISFALSLQSQEEKGYLAEAEKYEKEADMIEWRGSWYEGMGVYDILTQGGGRLFTYSDVTARDFASLLSRVGKYQAFSNFLADRGIFEGWVDQANADWMRKWQNVEGFLTTESFLFVPAICKEDDLKRSKSPGTSTQMVQTVSSYQFVGSIQAEISPRKVPILCTKEIKDEQEQFTCPTNLFCINNEFCAANEDATTPTTGYFYKLSWGVTAPTDEKSTPFIDEEGNAIKLNLRLEDENGGKEFFYKRANIQNENTIELRNGDHDGNTHAFYSPTRYVEACIIFSSGYQVKDLSGDPIKHICATFKTTERGKVEFENSNRQPSITTSSNEVQVNTNI